MTRRSEFDTDTSIEAAGEASFAGTVTDRWDIAGNPNGGYLLSFAVRGLAATLTKPDPLTLTAHYLRRPDKGPVRVEIEPIRAGRSLATGTARLVQGGSERVRVLATFGDLEAAAGATAVREGPPDLPPPDACLTRGDELSPFPDPPEIFRRLDLRLHPETGWPRGQGTGVAHVEGWVRFADKRPPDVMSLPFFADAFPPAVFELAPAAWVPTIELTVHVRARPAPGWLQGRFQTRHLIGGYLEEDGELWDSTGRLVAQSRQLAMLLT